MVLEKRINLEKMFETSHLSGTHALIQVSVMHVLLL